MIATAKQGRKEAVITAGKGEARAVMLSGCSSARDPIPPEIRSGVPDGDGDHWEQAEGKNTATLFLF